MEKQLYHFTSIMHLPLILSDQYLKLTESNLRVDREFYKPVVWFIANENPKRIGSETIWVDKKEIRITVRHKGHYKYWKTWSRQNKIPQRWAELLESVGDSDKWWVSREIVPISDFIRIENVKTGELYYENGQFYYPDSLLKALKRKPRKISRQGLSLNLGKCASALTRNA